MFFVKNAARSSGQTDDAVQALEAKPGVPIIVPAAEPIQYREVTAGRRNSGSLRIVGAAVGIAVLILGSVWYSRNTPEKALARESRTQEMARVESPKIEKETEISTAKKEPGNASTNGVTATVRESNPDEVFSRLKLQGIMYHGVSSSVLINGKTLHLGDQIEGARVFSVEPLQVTLEKDGMQHKLKLK
jgi:hypothetical protein